MAWLKCDACRSSVYTEDNPFVEIRQRRPSDPTEIACTIAGHKDCMPIKGDLPDIASSGGVATPKQWQEYIESPEAMLNGHLFLG